jgi:hypothetical protein
MPQKVVLSWPPLLLLVILALLSAPIDRTIPRATFADVITQVTRKRRFYHRQAMQLQSVICLCLCLGFQCPAESVLYGKFFCLCPCLGFPVPSPRVLVQYTRVDCSASHDDVVWRRNFMALCAYLYVNTVLVYSSWFGAGHVAPVCL